MDKVIIKDDQGVERSFTDIGDYWHTWIHSRCHSYRMATSTGLKHPSQSRCWMRGINT